MAGRITHGELELNESFKQINITDSGAFYGKIVSNDPEHNSDNGYSSIFAGSSFKQVPAP